MPRVVLCSVGVGPHEDLLSIGRPALQAWSDRHGYALDLRTEAVSTGRPVSWSKIRVLREHLDSYDVALWVDADVSLVDPSHDLATTVSRSRPITMVAHEYAGQRVPNMGVLALRAGATTRRLLDTLWGMTRFVEHRWWENAALLDLLGYDIRREPIRKTRRSPWDLRIRWLDHAWNSIDLDPSEQPIIKHYPGVSDEERRRRMLEDRSRAPAS